mgnify:CR=1 FL=1
MSKDTKYPMSSTNSRIQSLEKTIITLEEQIEKHKQEIINIKSKKSNRGIAIYLKLNPDIQDIIDKYVYMNNCDNKLELLTEYKCYCMSYSIIHSLWIKYPVNEKVVEYVGVGVWHHYPNYNANVIVNSINEDLLDKTNINKNKKYHYPRLYQKNKLISGIDKCKVMDLEFQILVVEKNKNVLIQRRV